MPNLVWEARHGWPTIEMSRNLRQEHSGLTYTLTFIPIQVLLPGWWIAPVWLAGLWALFREARWGRYRAFPVAYIVSFVLVGIFVGNRPYYFAALYAVLIAAGAIVADGVTQGTRRFFSTRRPKRRMVWRSRRSAVAFIVVLAALDLPISLPILPARALSTVPLQEVNYNLGETIGWPQLVATVAHVYRSLAPSERAGAAIVTDNYGEAGAIDHYGRAYGLPSAYSGHNSYWWWGPPRSSGPTIAVSLDRSSLSPYFRHISLAARIHNSEGVSNDEQGAPVWICRGRTGSWPAIWPAFKHYG
jgi:hypothetical protein